jgi:hypothetical protein
MNSTESSTTIYEPARQDLADQNLSCNDIVCMCLTKTRYCITNLYVLSYYIIEKRNNQAIRGDHRNKTESELPICCNPQIIYLPHRSPSTTKAAARSPRRSLPRLRPGDTERHALSSSPSPSPKSQVTRIPHADYDNGPVYIDESWRENSLVQCNHTDRSVKALGS